MINPNTIAINPGAGSAAGAASSNAGTPAAGGRSSVGREAGISAGTSVDGAEKDAGGRVKERPRPEELWDDIVSVSEDGDTVRVSDEGNEELNESRIGEARVIDENRVRGTQPQEDRNRIDAPELIEQGAEELREDRLESAKRRDEDREEAMNERRQNEELDKESAMKVAQQDENRAREIIEAQIKAAAEEKEKDAEAEKQAADEAAEAETQAAARPSNSFAGISDTQLEQMYRDGRISRYDYETEIDAREARKEELQSEAESVSRDTMKLNAEKDRSARMNEAIKNAVSDRASDTLSAEQRLDVIEKLSENITDKARREEEQGRLWDYQLLT